MGKLSLLGYIPKGTGCVYQWVEKEQGKYQLVDHKGNPWTMGIDRKRLIKMGINPDLKYREKGYVV
jgi:hypothetical protein